MKSFESYRAIGSFELMNLTQKEPSCFNGMVRVVKYKITVEEIEEPRDVIQARIQKLWDRNTNYHNWGCLERIGKIYGMNLR